MSWAAALTSVHTCCDFPIVTVHATDRLSLTVADRRRGPSVDLRRVFDQRMTSV